MVWYTIFLGKTSQSGNKIQVLKQLEWGILPLILYIWLTEHLH